MPGLRYLCLFAYSYVTAWIVLCFCFVCFRLVPCVVSFSGLFIFDCPFGILLRLFV
jgi:hypothetical protein